MIGVAVLGSTGSIGVSTLDVLARHPDRYRLVALAAGRQVEPLLEQCRRHRTGRMRHRGVVGVVESECRRGHRIDERGVQQVELFRAADEGGLACAVEFGENTEHDVHLFFPRATRGALGTMKITAAIAAIASMPVNANMPPIPAQR